MSDELRVEGNGMCSGGLTAAVGLAGAEARGHRGLAAVQMTGVVFFALCTGWAAGARMYLPGTPVPVTMQTLTVLLSGAILGCRLGAASMLIYLLMGCAGMPFFSGWRSGLAVACGPTGGYLIGFMAASWIVGKISWSGEGSWKRLFLAVSAGSAVIYLCGAAGLLVTVPGIDLAGAFSRGILPFLPGDLIKASLAVGLTRVAGPRTRRFLADGGEE